MKRTNWKKLYEIEKVKAEQAESRAKIARDNTEALLASDIVLNINEKVELTDELMKNVKVLYIGGGNVEMNLKDVFSIRVLNMYAGTWNIGASTLNLCAWDDFTAEHKKYKDILERYECLLQKQTGG